MTKSVRELLSWGSERLNSRLDARVLLGYCLSLDANQLLLHMTESVSERDIMRYTQLIERRATFEPIAYITEKKEFFSRDFRIRSDVLVPRPETEILIEKSLEVMSSKSSVLELCTGSGAVAVTLALEKPDWDVWATDISEAALSVARENAADYDVKITFLEGDLFSVNELEGRVFDLIVANPPYVSEKEYEELPETVRLYEPKLALVGGSDGLEFYQRIINEAPRFLNVKGMVLLEIGAGQGRDVMELARESKLYDDIKILRDYAGLDRVLFLKREHRL